MADLAVLIVAVGQSELDPDVGYLDADRTLTELLRELSPFVRVSDSVLESALAHANFLNEAGRFKDFRGNTFDELVSRIGRFNKNYNWFESED